MPLMEKSDQENDSNRKLDLKNCPNKCRKFGNMHRRIRFCHFDLRNLLRILSLSRNSFSVRVIYPSNFGELVPIGIL